LAANPSPEPPRIDIAPALRALVARPLAIAEEYLGPLLPRLAAGEPIEVAAPTRSAPVRASGGTAVLPLVGPIQQREDIWTYFGLAVSVEGFSRMLRAVLADDAVTSIVIDVDTPGGDVAGIDELAQEIFDARERKPITAVANGWAASAGYYLASQAKELVVTPSGMVGSIGVLVIHADFSRALDMAGVTPTIVRTPARKAEGNMFEPLSDEAREHLQSQVGAYYSMFVDAVARGRGVTQAKVRDDFGQGRMVMAREAVRLGMADRVATLDTVLGRHGGAQSARPARAEDAPSQITTETSFREAEGADSEHIDTERLARVNEIALARP
jgi:signal peptide peptidase SppA